MINHSSRWYYVVPPCILSFFTFLVYFPSLFYPFVFDDLPNISTSFEIQTYNPRAMFFANSRWLPRLFNQWTYYHWKAEPFIYRFSDLLIHILIALLIFSTLIMVLNRSKKDFFKSHALFIASTACGLYLLHPVQTQTVTYVTQMRLEGLVGLFSWLAIFFFTLASTQLNQTRTLICNSASAACLVLAAGTKEIVIVLPALMILFDWFFISQGNTKNFIKRLPVLATLTTIFYATLFWIRIPISVTDAVTLKCSLQNNRGNILTPQAGQLIQPIGYLYAQFKAMVHYLMMYIVPLGLTFDYGWKIPASFFAYESIFYFLLLFGTTITGLVLFIKDKTNMISFGLAWFFISVLPRASIIPSSELICDYKTYLASGGVIIALSTLLVPFFLQAKDWLVSKFNYTAITRTAQVIIPSLFFILIGGATTWRNTVWASPVNFWGDVIEKTEPHTPARVYNNYAVALIESGKQEEGLSYYHKAIATDPTYSEPHINLALHYQIGGDYNKAMEHYNISLHLNEAHPELFNNLGMLHFLHKAYPQAEECFRIATNLRPYYSKGWANLGRTYFAQNKMAEAADAFEHALTGNEKTIDIYFFLGATYHAMQQIDRAIPTLEVVVAQDPFFKDANQLLGSCHYMAKNYERSEQLFAQALQHQPDNVSLCYNMAQALLQQNKYAQALPFFMKCQNVTDQLPHTPLHIAKCLHYAGQHQEAVKHLNTLIKTTKYPELKTMGMDLMREIGDTKKA